MNIKTFRGGMDRNFSYLLWADQADGAILVDPATDEGPVGAALNDLERELTHILVTHTHSDHLLRLEAWTTRLPEVTVVGHRKPVNPHLPRYRGLRDGGEVAAGGWRLQLVETAGHYPDSVCWYAPAAGSLFTGDTVFVGRTGRTIGGLSDTGELYRSVYQRILTLPPETVVYPGHDYGPTPTATIGELQQGYSFFRCQNEAEFRSVMEHYESTRQPGA